MFRFRPTHILFLDFHAWLLGQWGEPTHGSCRLCGILSVSLTESHLGIPDPLRDPKEHEQISTPFVLWSLPTVARWSTVKQRRNK